MQPEYLTVVSPGESDEEPFGEQSYRVADSAAYVRRLQHHFQSFIEQARSGDAQTVAELAALDGDLPFRPNHGSAATYLSAAHQARMQVASRESGRLQHELLPFEHERGFALLPEPSPHDLFFDLEGDPFFGIDTAGKGGLEYLWGCRRNRRFQQGHR